MSRLLDGEAGAAEERALRRHLAGCLHCEGLWLAMRRADGALGAERGWAAPPAGYATRIMARVRVAPRPRRTWRTLGGPALTMGFGLLVVLGGVAALLPELSQLGEWAEGAVYSWSGLQPLLAVPATLRDALLLVGGRLLAAYGLWAASAFIILAGGFASALAVWSRLVFRMWSVPSGSGTS